MNHDTFTSCNVFLTFQVFDWVHYMVLSGNLPSFDVDSVVENETAKPATNYQLTTQDIRDLNVYCDNVLPLHPTNCNQFFSIERKVHGKSHVWRAQKLDSSDDKHVSSVVLVNYGNAKHVGRVLHFLSLPVSGINREFATTEIFSDFEQDPESCLYFVNTLSSHVTTLPFEFLSVPLVTAADDDSASILWLLNM